MESKNYRLQASEMKLLIGSSVSCIASDKITVDGEKVGYMYREEPEANYDSGWRFFSGSESQEYTDNAHNFAFYKINTIANYDKEIIPYLHFPTGSLLERRDGIDGFVPIDI